ASAAPKIGKIKTAEVERHSLTLAAAGDGTGAKTARAKTAAPSIGFGRSGIDVVGIKADLIVDLAFLGIAQDVVGFGDIFEFLFGFLVAGIDVRVVLARQPAEGFTDFFLRGAFLHAQNAVIVLLLCGGHLRYRGPRFSPASWGSIPPATRLNFAAVRT